MPSTTDPQDHRGLFALFKGESGMGKSCAALSFPSPYVFDHDGKMPAIAQKHFPGKRVDWDTFDYIFAVNQKMESFKVSNGGSCPYETIIGDSVTSLSYNCIKSIDYVKDTNVVKMLQNVKKTKGGKEQIELRGFDYYNGEDSFLKYYVDSLKELWGQEGNPKHVILLAHVLTSEQKDVQGKLISVTRRIVTSGNKIAAYIPAQFDDVFLFAREDPDFGAADQTKKRICITQGVGEDDAKTAHRFPERIDFTNRSLFDELCKYDDLNKRLRIGTEVLDAEFVDKEVGL